MMHRNFAWMAAPGVVMAVGLAVGMAGCESKLTMERFQSVKTGMTLDEVQALLGPGEKQTEGQATRVAEGFVGAIPGAGGKKPESTREVYLWKEDRAEISVVFEKGKVVDKNQRGVK